MPIKSKYTLLVLILIFKVVAVFAQSGIIQNVGVPYVQNYTKYAYKSGNQNWSLVRGENGVMYYGNSDGLLSFDGNKWQLYKMPHNIIVRAVTTDKSGKVYTGGYGEFGYWDYDTNGKFVYSSFIDLIPKAERPTDEIWKIYTDGNRVLFQSFSRIYIYENNRFTVVRGNNSFLFLHKVGNRFFVEVLSEGLYELKGNALSFVEHSDKLGTSGVLSILPYKKNSYLIGTAKSGLFIYDGVDVKPWLNEGDNFLKTYQLNNGSFVLNKYYAFGTILNGIIILDEEGRIVQQINKSSGLQNNTVLSLYLDKEYNLWAGLDNGIDRIEINSPLYFYFDKVGRFGTVYSSIIYQDKIYLGTNQGLFYSEWADNNKSFYQSFDFKLIPNSQGQVWDLTLIDGQLICGHNNGTFRIEGTKIIPISNVNGGWTIKKFTQNSDKLIQGTYTGLVLYAKDESGKWKFSHKLENYGEPSTYVEMDNSGSIWASHPNKGLYRLIVDKDFKQVTQSKNFGKEQGLPSDFNINIFKVNNRIIFSTAKGFFIYDDISDKFMPYNQLNEKLGTFASSNKVIKAADQKYWFINHGKVALVNMAQPGRLEINTSPFSVLNGRMVQHYENISRISNTLYLISIDDGFVIYNQEAANQFKATPLPPVLVTQIENITDKSTVISELGHKGRPIRLPFTENNIRISYALPYYSQATVKFQYFLEGYSNNWSEWNFEIQKEFTNLAQGDYTFQVRAKVNENQLSETTSFQFSVLPPWYATYWAKIIYALILLAIIFLVRYLFNRKLRRDKIMLEQKLEQEKEEYKRQQQIETEQKLVKLKNEQLEVDLAGKSRELANSALNIVYKNELLQTIKDEVLHLNDLSDKSLPQDQFKKIQKIIDEGMSDEQDWQLFESSFNEAHENYFKKLKADHPDLTPNDLKLCAFLRMNMNSKEIASLLNITVRGVELRRYRLRKRLNLEHETNLTEYLLNV
ncbi:triple tyrosine motif-containing protein [Pontibacter sp. SGAir0037]|uniref:ligand-binding sensor domain-containing protein n=1 Tax=Pontibacter sp. SGAir0037 TaxID=2571030 RepID=UPI0010CD5FF6|nr:triple tyrosine motif-containing protein [Pontibacter sp. SGAir0037]QCR22253.1 transcriptional regulator [Pontibacter sp. SGAir0037]